MDIHPKYRSAFGYQTGGGGVDSYGVDHSNFSLRDEIKYQTNRVNKENQLKNYYNNQGITKNYPQYGSDFWNVANSVGGNQLNNVGYSANNNNFGGNYRQQNQALTPWKTTVAQTISSPWRNNQTVLPYNGGYDLSKYPQNNASSQIDYSLYGDGFSKEFIDQMLSDDDYLRALQEYVIPNEGGYVNNKNDPGGETNMGISKRYHPSDDIKNLTRERANAILYKEFWNWNGINKLPREVRGFVFDHGVRTSPQNAIETTHRALGITPVGDIIGNKTLELLQQTDYNDFLLKYQDLVREQDRNNKNYKHFGIGWDNRTNGYHVSY